MSIDAWTALGARPAGARLERIEQSRQWDGSRFVNSEPMWNDHLGILTSVAGKSAHTSPKDSVPVERRDGRFSTSHQRRVCE